MLKIRLLTGLPVPKTYDMMNQSFVLTQQILDNVAKAIAPLMHALAQVALVGQEALASMSNSWEGLAIRFDKFMATARQTGKLRMWIDDAIQGVKDLGRIFSQTGQLLELSSVSLVLTAKMHCLD